MRIVDMMAAERAARAAPDEIAEAVEVGFVKGDAAVKALPQKEEEKRMTSLIASVSTVLGGFNVGIENRAKDEERRNIARSATNNRRTAENTEKLAKRRALV